MRAKLTAAAFTSLIVAGQAAAQPATSQVYGLTIGIDRYEAEAPLYGAVADSEDIEQALLDFGAVEVRQLLDGEASAAAIEAAYFTLLRRARRGDVLVVHYSGHGTQQPEAVIGDEADGKDEVFLLSRFDRTRRETHQEVLLDNTLSAWFARASQRGVSVILVADSCHSGTMARGTRAPGARRDAPPFTPPGYAPEAPGPGFVTDARIPPGVTLLSAVPESQRALEFELNGRARGALSYVFARGLRGFADGNGDGRISRFELEQYVTAQVRAVTEDIQHPVIAPRSAADTALLEGQTTTPAPQPARIEAVDFASRGGAAPSLDGVRRVDEQQAVLIWEATSGTLYTDSGEVAARNVDAGNLQDLIYKHQTVAWLRRLSEANSFVVETDPVTSDVLRENDIITIDAGAAARRFYVALNLANDGTVQYLEGGQARAFRAQVTAPFGMDHLFVLGFDVPPYALVNRLEAGITPRELRDQLPGLLEGMALSVGQAVLYTAP